MILKLKDIRKSYKINKKINEEIFTNLNLNFKSGEFVCILGESGSGKSTLINMIGGLDLNYEGNIFIDGKNLKNIDLDNYRREKIGFIFQNFNLIPNLTVLENVMIRLDMSNLKRNIKIRKCKAVLEKLGLLNVINKMPNELSGGQKQRVSIARVLVTNPDIILADEPTGALDIENGIKVLEILKEVCNDGKLVIVVTHSRKVIEYSSRVITIQNKEVITDEVLKDINIENNSNITKRRKISLLTSIKFGVRNVFKNIKRNLLISFASSIGIIGIILSLYISSSVKDFIEKEINNKASPKVLDIKKKNVNELYETSYYNNNDIENIRSIENIKEIYKQVIYTNSASIINDNKKYDLVTFSSYNSISDDEIIYGNVPKENEIVISKYLADKISNTSDYSDILNKSVDLFILDNSMSEPFLLKDKLIISGIYKEDKISIINDSMYAYISYNNLSNIYLKNNKKLFSTNVSIEVDEIKNIEKVKENINKLNYECTSTTNLLDDIFKYLDILTFILSSFSFISLIVSSIMIMIIMYINVIERTKEIGIFCSLGLGRRDIKRIFKCEALVLGVVIGLNSSIISILISKLIKTLVYDNFSIKFISINYENILFGIILSIIICLISNIIPSAKASSTNPIDALRYE